MRCEVHYNYQQPLYWLWCIKRLILLRCINMADDEDGATSPLPSPDSSSGSEDEAEIGQNVDDATMLQRQCNDFARVHGMRLPRDLRLWTKEQWTAFETFQLTASTNFRSEFFDPLAALYEPGLLPPIPTIRPLDNVHKASILVRFQQSAL